MKINFTLNGSVKLPGKNLVASLGLILLSFFSLQAHAEGTKQAMPDSANGTGLYLATGLLSGPYLNCAVDQRLRFSIKDHTVENLYFALQARDRSLATPPLVTNMYYKIFNPLGTLVAGPTLIPSTAGSNGFIQHYSQAVAGPNIGGATPVGYAPITFDPVVNGDYYVEIYRSADGGTTQVAQASLANSIILVYFDFTVAQTNNTQYTGRINCNKWGFITYIHSKPPTAGAYTGDITKSFSGDFYGYTADSIICKVNFQPLFRPLAFNLAMTKYGVVNNVNWINDRRSIWSGGSGSPTFAGGYRIFLNQPDLTIFPNSVLPNSPVFKSITGCPGNWVVNFTVDNTGDARLLLDLNGTAGYQAATSDRILYGLDLTPGTNSLPWDGKDGLGNVVSGGFPGDFTFSLLRGRTNVPMFDAEMNTNGFSVDGILPSAFATNLFWCDTALNVTTNNTCPAVPSATEIADNSTTGKGVDNSIAGTTGITHAWDGIGAGLAVPATAVGSGSSTANNCDDFGNGRTINTWFWPTASNTSTFSITVPTGCVVLPVVNLQFTGAIKQNAIQLTWKTEQEINTAYFEIERSSDGITYTTIALVNAVGNSSTRTDYAYVDKKIADNATYYYRLKQTDIDGKSVNSKTILVKTGSSSGVTVSITPNPFSANTVISLQLEKAGAVEIAIVNAAGKTVHSFAVKGSAGFNRIPLTNGNQLPAGIYFIRVKTEKGTGIEKLIKL
jgi:Secretion system C-terminal sorting domain